MTSQRRPDSGPPSNPAANGPAGKGTLSGRWVVIGMFAFAITATGILYVYWKLHVGPFVPLQKALAQEFKGSRPLVEGGQRKMHRNTPRILRITMKIDFNPDTDEKQAGALAERVIGFTKERFDLSTYDLFELHFFWPEPEKETHEWSLERKVSEL